MSRRRDMQVPDSVNTRSTILRKHGNVLWQTQGFIHLEQVSAIAKHDIEDERGGSKVASNHKPVQCMRIYSTCAEDGLDKRICR